MFKQINSIYSMKILQFAVSVNWFFRIFFLKFKGKPLNNIQFIDFEYNWKCLILANSWAGLFKGELIITLGQVNFTAAIASL